MPPERWAQLEKLFQDVLSQDPAQRAEFLSRCSDQSLRDDLERLILEYENLGTFLEKPPDDSLADETKTLTRGMLVCGEVLRGRYRIVRLVGHGGMGEVYEAEDLELRSRVALKTLRAGVPSAAQSMERFKREIILGRRVTHPNVCRLFDIDRAAVAGKGEVIFLTMEFLDGETLYQRLKRSGRMSLSAAAPVVENIIAGLAACHKHGIVHRDFKSSNVMLAGDAGGGPRAVLTDFGLAYTDRAWGEEEPELTVAGGIMGTPGYMAPEQKEGRAATQASDIYALGVVLCEMLTGRRPDGGALPADHPQLNETWKGVILRCLKTEPSDRFSSAGEVGEALGFGTATVKESEKVGQASVRPGRRIRRILLAALVLLTMAMGWLAYHRAHALPDQKHVAILPFHNLSNNAADQVFCEGLAETLTSKLSQLERYQKSFWVVPASESRHVTDPHDAYRKLEATLVVSGSLERLPNKTVLVINLIDPQTRRQLASRDIDTPANDLSGLEGDAWQRVADLLDLQLQPEQVRSLEAGRARVPGAYVAYAQGVGYMRRNGMDTLDRAIALFDESIRRDPSYALPYSGLGSAYALKYEMTQDTHWLDPAQANAKRAVELAPDLAQVHLTLGQIDFSKGRDEESEHELTRAQALDPNVIEAHFYLGRLYEREGKLPEAEHDFRSAVARRPEYWRAHSELATFFYNHGRFAEAEREFVEALKLQPDNSLTLTNLGAIYMSTGKFEEAVGIFENDVRVKPDDANAYANLGSAFMFLGRYAEAVAPMEQAVKLKPSFIDAWRDLGDAYQMAPGQSGKAAGAYRQALELGHKQLAINPRDWGTMASMALFEAHLNNRPEALRLAKLSAMMAPTNSDVLFTSALTHEILGLRPAALQLLRAAHEKGYSLEDIEREPVLEAMHKDRRYQAWVQQARITLTQTKK